MILFSVDILFDMIHIPLLHLGENDRRVIVGWFVCMIVHGVADFFGITQYHQVFVIHASPIPVACMEFERNWIMI